LGYCPEAIKENTQEKKSVLNLGSVLPLELKGPVEKG